MPLVQAWMCDKTQKFFLEKNEYVSHLKILARDRLAHRKKMKRIQHLDSLIQDLYRQTSFEAIEKWINENYDLLFARAHENGGRSKSKVKPVISDFKLTNMRWNISCSNSHHAPKGKKTNWGGNKNLPRGYPGWRGDVSYRLTGYDSFHSDPFRGIGIHIGSGGGRSDNRYEYDVTLFAEEFSAMAMFMKLTDEITGRIVL